MPANGSSSSLPWSYMRSSYMPSKAFVMQQLKNDFVISLFGMFSRASWIHRQIWSNSTLPIRPLALKVCWPASIHTCHFFLIRSLKGMLTAAFRGCNILVIPPLPSPRNNNDSVFRKLMNARGRRPKVYIVFECLETPMKHEARVFLIAS